MNIIVLGGNGFIGSHIVDELMLRGHSVSVLCRSREKVTRYIADVKYYYGDFLDSVVVNEAIQGKDAVIHSISSTVPSTSVRNPVIDINQNLVATVNLLEIMIRSNVKRLIYLSSGGTVYGSPKYLPVNEDHPLNPISSYGVVKVAIENYIGMFKELYGLKPIILRPSNPYGTRQGHAGIQGALSTFLGNTLANKKITIWGDGEIKRGYIYVKDLARLCSIAVESSAEGTFNVCSGTSTSLNQILEYIESVTGVTPLVEYQMGRAFDVKDILLNIDKVQSVFGWEPKYFIQDGIADYYKNLQNQLNTN